MPVHMKTSSLADRIPFQLSVIAVAACDGITSAGRHMRHGSSASDKSIATGHVLAWLIAGLAVAIGVALAAIAMSLPDPAPKSAPADAFSAERAMEDVRAIAVRPHPIGSPENDAVRALLVERMRSLGLDPQVRDQTGITTDLHMSDLGLAGRVRNIVGELKGSDPALPAVVLMAHYDTVPHSPGAGDDTSGIAVALEVARALRASGPMRRSVIFLFTDGEEAGLLGASAFFHDDPWRRRAGLVINLEARGDSGPTSMFQTSPGNRGLIDVFARNALSPTADSLTVTLYKQMPNDTDLTAALNKGYAGLNFAFAAHQMAYHTAISTPESLNPGSIQHMGGQVLPVVRAFARAEQLPGSADDLAFADLFGLTFIAYPFWVGWLLALVAIGTATTALVVGIRRGRIDWRDALRGAGGLVALLLGISVVLLAGARLAGFLLRDVASPYALISQFGWLLGATALLGIGTGLLLVRTAMTGRRRAAALWLIAAGAIGTLLGTFSAIIVGLGVAAALFAFVSFGKRPALAGSLSGFLAGAVALVALFALVLQIVLPGGAHALVWPLLPLAGIGATLVLSPDRAARPAGLVVAGVAAALLMGLMATNFYAFFVLMGPLLPPIVAPFIVIAVLGLAALIGASRVLGRVGAALVAGGLALCVVAGIAGRTPTAATPEMVEAFHLDDIDARTAYWVGGKLDPSGWVKSVMEQDGGVIERRPMPPLMSDPTLMAKAKPGGFVRPGLTVAIVGEGAARRIDIRAANTNGGRYMRIFLKPSVPMAGLTLGGRKLPAKLAPGKWSALIFHASGADPVAMTLPVAAARGKLEVRMMEVRDGWPAGAKALPKPANVVPFRRDGTSAIVARAAVAW